jgi:hypothetical protein
MVECYKHSGKSPVMGLLLASSIAVFAAICLGVVYGYANVYISFEKLHALLTAAFGAGLGGIVVWAARLGHIRSRLMPTVLALLAALVGLYAAWGADAMARMGVPKNGDLFLTFRPSFLREYIAEFYAKGFWGFGNAVGDNKGLRLVSGIELLVFWSLEAVTVLGLAAVCSYFFMGEMVYCEECGHWTKSKKDFRRFAYRDNAVLARITDGDLTCLDGMPKAAADEKRSLRLNVNACLDCGTSNYVTIQSETKDVSAKGKVKTKTTTILRHRRATVDELDAIRRIGEQPT